MREKAVDMQQNSEIQTLFVPDTKSQVDFSSLGPQPRFLWNESNFKVILAGLEPGQRIPAHPETLAMYHFLEGTGAMTVDEELFPVQAGTTIVTPAGARRGIYAETRLIFLAAKPA